MFARTRFFHLARPSLVRGTLLSLAAFAVSLRLGGFPYIADLHSSRWQLIPTIAGFCGMVETARCMARRWSLYQFGVLLLLYTEVMILGLAIFLLFYP